MAAGDGLVTMTPTSIVVAGAGSSASINSDGGVDFTSATSLSLNGVFASGFDNYMLSFRCSSAGSDNILWRLRLSGTDNTTSNSYVSQQLQASGATASGQRLTANFGYFALVSATQRCGETMHIYGPNLAQPTAARVITADDFSSALIDDFACTHNQSTAYDGITLYSSVAFTGNIVVFGYEE